MISFEDDEILIPQISFVLQIGKISIIHCSMLRVTLNYTKFMVASLLCSTHFMFPFGPFNDLDPI